MVPAAGRGERLGLGPKGLLRLGPKTLLEIVTATLATVVDEVVIAYPPGNEADVSALALGDAKLVPGGATRQETIWRLVDASQGHRLLIQDVARPFASAALCRAVLEAAVDAGAAGAFLDPVVPVGVMEQQSVSRYYSREQVGIFQAPQVFTRPLLESVRAVCGDRQYQSTAQMVMAAGHALHAVSGEPENIKITTALDWEIARRVIAPSLGLTGVP